MRVCNGLILLMLCLLLTERSGGSVQALRLDRILGIVDRFSQIGSSGSTKAETITEDNTSETEKHAEEVEEASSELLEAEEDDASEDIDRTHHKHHEHHKHKKAPILATKTVFLQVTKHVTRHPVCMTVHEVKPPCLPAELVGGGHHGYYDGVHGHDWWGREDIWADDMQEEGLYIEPTATVRISEATASVDLPESRAKEEEDTEEYTTEFVEPSTRTGRYLELKNRETPAPPSTTASSAINDQPTSEDRHLGGLMSHKHHKKDYKYVTKTLVVTKVQPVTDYRVTATLEAKNCIPHDIRIPFCPGPNTPYIPLSPLHPIVHGLPEKTVEHVEEVQTIKPIIFDPIIKPPHKPVKPILPLPIKPPHKPIKPIFDKPEEHELPENAKPPHKPVIPILPLPIKPPHKPIKPIFDKPEEHEHPEHAKPPHVQKPEKPTKPIIPIISSILSSHKPSKPVILQEGVDHTINSEASEQQEEVFDSVDEDLKTSAATLEDDVTH